MKAMLLATGLLLLGCSPSDRPVSRSPVAQMPVPMSEEHDTSRPHEQEEKIDTNLVLPRLRQSATFCADLDRAWYAYLRGHPRFKQRFPSDTEHLGYDASLWFTIDRTGRVRRLKKPNYPNPFDGCCYDVLAPLVLRTVWSPFYKRTATGNRYAPLNVSVRCYLSPTYALSLRLDGMTVDESGMSDMSGYGFFSCHLP